MMLANNALHELQSTVWNHWRLINNSLQYNYHHQHHHHATTFNWPTLPEINPG